VRFVPKPLRRTADISRGTQSRRAFLTNCVLVTAFFLAVYVVLGVTADLVAGYIPDRYEAKLFSAKTRKDAKGDGDFRRAERIFAKLIERPGLRQLPYHLYALPMDKPNAVAFPGGGVGVTPALLKNVRSETGLAMVFSHELGHHQHRHALKNLGRGLLYQVTLGVMFGTRTPPVIGGAVYTGEMRYSRKAEREADEFALRMGKDVYGDTRGALEFFEMIHEKYCDGHETWVAFVATHPDPEARLEHLRELQVTLDGR